MPGSSARRRSRRISVVGLKGGVGKTTTAVFLGQAAHDAGHSVVVIDADPQASAVKWAAEAGDHLGPTVIGQATAGLARTIDRLDADADVTIIDTPPHGAGAVTAGALAVADLAIIPVGPTPAEMTQLADSIEMVREAGCPFAVVLVRARGGTRSREDAAAALAAADGVPFASTVIPLREAVAQAPTGGKPPTARSGYAELWAELEGALDG